MGQHVAIMPKIIQAHLSSPLFVGVSATSLMIAMGQHMVETFPMYQIFKSDISKNYPLTRINTEH